MALYMCQFSYTTDALKALVTHAQDRARAATEAPDNATVAALAMLVGQSGTLSRFETTALLDMTEAQQAMQLAAKAAFDAP